MLESCASVVIFGRGSLWSKHAAWCQACGPQAGLATRARPAPPAPPPQVSQLPGERSYHVFYQLVAGASDEERAAYHLPADAADFKYLSRSGCLVGSRSRHGGRCLLPAAMPCARA